MDQCRTQCGCDARETLCRYANLAVENRPGPARSSREVEERLIRIEDHCDRCRWFGHQFGTQLAVKRLQRVQNLLAELLIGDFAIVTENEVGAQQFSELIVNLQFLLS